MGSMMNKARDFLGWGVSDADDFDAYVDSDFVDYTDSPADIVAFPAYEEEKATAMPARTPSFDAEARAAENFRIETVHPTSFNDARSIGDFFRKGIPVVVNLTDLAEDEARRVLDFIAGLAFGLEGSASRVTNRVFLLTPKNVEVTEHANRERSFR